ncbi:hypothetical protein ACFSYD_12190 [Paracoccus aerius]
MVIAITGGWAISGNTSPFTASVLLVGKLGVSRHAMRERSGTGFMPCPPARR